MPKDCYFFGKAQCRLHGYNIPTTAGGRIQALRRRQRLDLCEERCEIGTDSCSYLSEGRVAQGCAFCKECRHSVDYPGNEDMEELMDIYDQVFAGTRTDELLTTDKSWLFNKLVGYCNFPDLLPNLEHKPIALYLTSYASYLLYRILQFHDEAGRHNKAAE